MSKWHSIFRTTLLALVLCTVAATARSADSTTPNDAPQSFTVSQTYNQSPFEYRMKLASRHIGYRVYKLTYPSPTITPDEANNTVKADLYLPDNFKPGDPKRPAAITLHVLNGDTRVNDLACSLLALRGLPAVMLWLPYYGPRAKPEGWQVLMHDPKLFLGMLQQSIVDVRRTVDLLASRPEIDPQRIDLTGFSLGGIVSANAAGSEPRIFRTCMFLAGSNLLDILDFARYTRDLSQIMHNMPAPQRAELEKQVQSVEPLQLAAGLRQRALKGQVLMINAANDEIIPRRGTEKLAEALGIADRVVWIDGMEHNTFISGFPGVVRRIVDYFAQDLPPDVKPVSPTEADQPTHAQRAAAFLQQALAMMTTEPEPGRCHAAELRFALANKDQKAVETRLKYVRGSAGRFALKCTVPLFGDVSIGRGQSPWMVTGSQWVLLGVKNPTQQHNPLCYADPRHLAKLRILSGLVGSLVLVPDILAQWATIEGENQPNGESILRISETKLVHGSLSVSFQKDGRTPTQLAFEIAGVSGKAAVSGWQVNAVAEDSQFQPPADLPKREVDEADLYRTFSTIFNLAMQNVK